MTQSLRKIHGMTTVFFIRLIIVQKKQPWFDEECSAKRQIFYNELDNFHKNKSVGNQRKLTEARRNFKKEIRRKRYLFDKSKTEKLIASKSKNVKEYWRLLKKQLM